MDINFGIARESIEKRVSDSYLENDLEKSTISADEEWTHLDGLKSFYKLRKKWSWFILTCIAFLLITQASLMALVGTNVLDFRDYDWFLPIVVSENFIQIIGLALIVVKFLFSNHFKIPSRKQEAC